jgi:hypothetical protein
MDQITKPQLSVLGHKPKNSSEWFWCQITRTVVTDFDAKLGETINLGFDAKPRNSHSPSPCVRCRPHTASPNLSIIRSSSIRHVLDHHRSSTPSLLLLRRSSSLLDMLQLSPTHQEISKHVSPHETDSMVKPQNFLDSNSSKGKSITYHKLNQGTDHLISQNGRV